MPDMHACRRNFLHVRCERRSEAPRLPRVPLAGILGANGTQSVLTRANDLGAKPFLWRSLLKHGAGVL